MLRKKGMGKLEVAGIVLFIVVGFLILFQSMKIIAAGKDVGTDEVCRASVQASAGKFKVKPNAWSPTQTIESNLQINCPRNYVQIDSSGITSQKIGTKSKSGKIHKIYEDKDDPDKKKKEIALFIATEMKDCWRKFGTVHGNFHDINVDQDDQGEAVNIKSICFECSNIIFKDSNLILDGSLNELPIVDHLLNEKIIESSETFYEYITGETEPSQGVEENPEMGDGQWSIFAKSYPLRSASGNNQGDPDKNPGPIQEFHDENLNLGRIKHSDTPTRIRINAPDLVAVSVVFSQTARILNEHGDTMGGHFLSNSRSGYCGKVY